MNFCAFIIIGLFGYIQYSMANVPQDADTNKSERSSHIRKSHNHSTSGSSDGMGSMSKATKVQTNQKSDQRQSSQERNAERGNLRTRTHSEFYNTDDNYDADNEMKSYKPQYSQDSHHRHTPHFDKGVKASKGSSQSQQAVKYNQHVAFDEGGHNRDSFHTHKTHTHRQRSESRNDQEQVNDSQNNIAWRKSHNSKHHHHQHSNNKSPDSDEISYKASISNNQKSKLYVGGNPETTNGDQTKTIDQGSFPESSFGSKGQHSSYRFSGKNGRGMDGRSFSQSSVNNQNHDNMNSQGSLKSFPSNYGMNGENLHGFTNNWLNNMQQDHQFPLMSNADPFRSWNLNTNNMHAVHGPDQLTMMGMGVPNLPQMPMLPQPLPMNTDALSSLKQNNENWMKYMNSMNPQLPGSSNPIFSNSFLQGNSGQTQNVQRQAQFPFVSGMQQQHQSHMPLAESESRTTHADNKQIKTQDGVKSDAKLVESKEARESSAGGSSKSHIIQTESKDSVPTEISNSQWKYKTSQDSGNRAQSSVTDVRVKSHETTKVDTVSFTQNDTHSKQIASLIIKTTNGSKDGGTVIPYQKLSNNFTNNSTQESNLNVSLNHATSSKHDYNDAKKSALACTSGLCKWEFRNKTGNGSTTNHQKMYKSFTSFLNYSEDHTKRTVNLQQHVCASESVKFSFYHDAPYFTVQVEGISATESPHVIIPTAEDDYFLKIKIECEILPEIKNDDNDAGCLLLFTRHKNSTVMIKERDKVEFTTSYNEGVSGGANKAHLQVNHYHEDDSEEISGQKIRFRPKSNVVLEYAIPTEEDICTVLTCKLYAHKTLPPSQVNNLLPSVITSTGPHSNVQILNKLTDFGQIKPPPQDAALSQVSNTRLTKTDTSEHNTDLLSQVHSYQTLTQNQVKESVSAMAKNVHESHNEQSLQKTPSSVQTTQLSHSSKIDNEHFGPSLVGPSQVDSRLKNTTKPPSIPSTTSKVEIGESNSTKENPSVQFTTSKKPNVNMEMQNTTLTLDTINVQYPQQTPPHLQTTIRSNKHIESIDMNSKTNKTLLNGTISSSNATNQYADFHPGFAPGLKNSQAHRNYSSSADSDDLFRPNKNVGEITTNQTAVEFKKSRKLKTYANSTISNLPPLQGLSNEKTVSQSDLSDQKKPESGVTLTRVSQPISTSFTWTTPALKLTVPTTNAPVTTQPNSKLHNSKDLEQIHVPKQFEITSTPSLSIITSKVSTGHSSRNTCSNGQNLNGCSSSSESIISHTHPKTVTSTVSKFAGPLNEIKTDATTMRPFLSRPSTALNLHKISPSIIENKDLVVSQIRPSNVDWSYKFTTKPSFIPSTKSKVKPEPESHSSESSINPEIQGHYLVNLQNPNPQEQAKLADKDPFHAISILTNNENIKPQYITSMSPNVLTEKQRTALAHDNHIYIPNTDTSTDKITQANKIRPIGRGFDGNSDSDIVTTTHHTNSAVLTEIASPDIPPLRDLSSTFSPSSRQDILSTLENILNGNDKDDRQCSCRCPCLPKVVFHGIPIGIVEKIGKPVVDPKIMLKQGESLATLLGRDKYLTNTSPHSPASFEIFEDADEDSDEHENSAKNESHSKQTLSKHVYLNLTALRNGTFSWVEAKVGDSLSSSGSSSETKLDFLPSQVMSMTLRKRKPVEKVALSFKVFNVSQMKKCSTANTNVETHLFFGKSAQVFIELGNSATVTLLTNEDVAARAKSFSLGTSKIKMVIHVGRAEFSTKSAESSNGINEKTFYVTLSPRESPCKLVLKG